MTLLSIFKLDSEASALSELQEGEHIIGRGTLLQCDDRRVSRNHGVIKVTESEVTITSTHINPCFYQPATSKTISILTKDTPMTIGDGDKFALLANDFWYRIKFETDPLNKNELSNTNCITGNTSITLKREVEDELPGCSKKLKTEEDNKSNLFDVHENKENINGGLKYILNSLKNETDICVKVGNENHTHVKIESDVSECTSSKTQDSDSLYEQQLKAALFSSDEDDNTVPQIDQNGPLQSNETGTTLDADETNCEIVQDQSRVDLVEENIPIEESLQNIQTDIPLRVDDNANKFQAADQSNADPTDDTNQAGPSKKRYRDRCWYGLECYRKKEGHFEEYCHPGDSDYNSDSNDDRPVCAFGATCYRKNKDHRKAYKHPKNKQKPTKKRKKVTAAANKKRVPKKQYNNDSSEDDYDLDDPFIDDSGSDYEVESTDDDSDSSNSSGGSEENTKRLLKEAKRFTKDKKDD